MRPRPAWLMSSAGRASIGAVQIRALTWWGSARIVLYGSNAWEIRSWPEGVVIDAGAGLAIPCPSGKRWAVATSDALVLEGVRHPPQFHPGSVRVLVARRCLHSSDRPTRWRGPVGDLVGDCGAGPGTAPGRGAGEPRLLTPELRVAGLCQRIDDRQLLIPVYDGIRIGMSVLHIDDASWRWTLRDPAASLFAISLNGEVAALRRPVEGSATLVSVRDGTMHDVVALDQSTPPARMPAGMAPPARPRGWWSLRAGRVRGRWSSTCTVAPTTNLWPVSNTNCSVGAEPGSLRWRRSTRLPGSAAPGGAPRRG